MRYESAAKQLMINTVCRLPTLYNSLEAAKEHAGVWLETTRVVKILGI